MKTSCTLQAVRRDSLGTGSARELRRGGHVPSVLYGSDAQPVHFAVEEKEIKREYHKGGFFGRVVTLKIDGKDVFGIPKDIQLHPVSDRVVHADFLKVEPGKDVKVMVPVKFSNYERCVGIRRGGTLNVVRYELELLCAPNAIPDMIEVDLLNLNIGDSVHISHVSLPEGVRPTIERDFTIAAVAGRVSKATAESEAEGGAAAA